jgi:hypothetical protein
VREQNRIPYWQDRQTLIVAAFPLTARLNYANEIACHECPYIKLLLIGFSNPEKSTKAPDSAPDFS